MDIWDSPYYRHSRICLKPFGLWPFQNFWTKLTFRIATMLAVSTTLIPRIVKAYEQRYHLHNFLLCIPSLLYYSHYMTKFLLISFQANKARSLLKNIKSDFSYFKGESLHVLHDYSEEARKFNNFYLMYMCSSVGLYNAAALLPQTLDVLAPLNESRPRRPIHFVRYNLAAIDDSFYFGLLHGLTFDLFAIVMIVGFDSLLFNCAQHACALFKIVVLELRNSAEISNHPEDVDQILKQQQQAVIYRRISNSIIIHKHALEFSDDLDSMCAIVNLLILSISVATATFTEFETMLHKEDFDIMLRYACFTGAQFLNLLYCNYPGQRIKDHSLLVHNSCWELEWYRESVPDGGKKLLILMMLKSQTPSCLTAGKLFVLDMQNFVKILKASVSYFAFLTSVQKH